MTRNEASWYYLMSENAHDSRGTQREYSRKPLKHSIVERI